MRLRGRGVSDEWVGDWRTLGLAVAQRDGTALASSRPLDSLDVVSLWIGGKEIGVMLSCAPNRRGETGVEGDGLWAADDLWVPEGDNNWAL
eukprot:446977-Pyramimonas_sp.AAC.1